ncbi:RNA polymerase sigma factor [Prosthecomicrobium pneumaticum]|uniref:RNA polymerase sigma factor n=1 Tax=Prosthecomicrobium pneumaticum TaxID=81895 RepID=A0A7W9CUT2_9HYPH|nr:sigma-70 family RNA polymerase sigma factor [Prosthecomicrobium pneumaticum]MBB5752318.1 RNA polymerase sigma-70 factor (ECF subfamily) [Prosthecomicrobium pneumaticum]
MRPAAPGATSPADDPDAPLVAALRQGDERALAELIRRHGGRLRTLVLRFSGRRDEADDIVQETFVVAWKEAARWRPGAAPFAAFLTRVAINRAIDRARRARLWRWTGLAETAEPEDPAPGPEAAMIDAAETRAVLDDIRTLPDRQRAAILLAAEGDRGVAEIAATLGVSEGAAEQLLVRARRTLRTKLAARQDAGEGDQT